MLSLSLSALTHIAKVPSSLSTHTLTLSAYNTCCVGYLGGKHFLLSSTTQADDRRRRFFVVVIRPKAKAAAAASLPLLLLSLSHGCGGLAQVAARFLNPGPV